MFCSEIGSLGSNVSTLVLPISKIYTNKNSNRTVLKKTKQVDSEVQVEK
jgi:hypothetical protein